MWDACDLDALSLSKTTGMSGPEWVTYLEKIGVTVTRDARQLLSSTDFVKTSGVSYVITTDGRATQLQDRQYPEVACLIANAFVEHNARVKRAEWIVPMHTPIRHGIDNCFGRLFVISDLSGIWLGVIDASYCLDDDHDVVPVYVASKTTQ